MARAPSAGTNVTSVAVRLRHQSPAEIHHRRDGDRPAGAGLVLRNNGGDDLAVSANGAFTFATSLTSGSTYAVTVATQPSGQTCSVSNGSGTVAGANVTTVAVACVTNPPPRFTVGRDGGGPHRAPGSCSATTAETTWR